MSPPDVATIREAARSTPVLARPDVLVVGGGSAGIAAASAAAREGADTLLIDRYGFLGGTLTAVTLGGFCGTHAVLDDERLGRIIGGLYLDIEERLAARDAVRPPKRHGRIVGVPYESATLKLVADEFVDAHGAKVLLHTHAVDAVAGGGRIEAVIVENKGGRGAIMPSIVIDASGDADVAARAGAGFELGCDGETQYGSTMFRLGGVDIAQASTLSRQDIRACLESAVEAGHPLPRTTTGVHVNPLEGVVHLNVTKVGDEHGRPPDLTDPEALTRAEREGRRQVYLYERAFREYVPGFARARVIDIGAMIGIRETRLVHGERVLSEADVRGCLKPDDRIACSSWALERHGQGSATAWEFLPDAEWYGIPYGCLVVRGFDNLLVAGRNLSASHGAQASARVAGPCFAMGEAAGIAATIGLSARVALRDVPVASVQRTLERHGAILTPEWS